MSQALFRLTLFLLTMFVGLPASAQATRAAGSREYDYILSACISIGQKDVAMLGGEQSIFPASELELFYREDLNKDIHVDYSKTILAQAPEHGEIGSSKPGYFGYTPKPGFVGQDKAVFMVEAEGKKYKVTIALAVRNDYVNESNPTCDSDLHFKPKLIKAR